MKSFETSVLRQPQDDGIPVNRKRIQRLMGLVSVALKPNTSRQRKGHKVYPYLLKKMSIAEPNQVWCSDITYIRLAHGFVYLTANGLGKPLCAVLGSLSYHG